MKKSQKQRLSSSKRPTAAGKVTSSPRRTTRKTTAKNTPAGSAARTGKRSEEQPPAATEGVADMDLVSIERLVLLMAEHDLLEIEVRNGRDRKVRLSRRAPEAPAMMYSAPPAANLVQAVPSAPAPAAAGSEPPAAPPIDAVEFVSPMVGTFYRAPSPESPPYVTAGDKVTSETIICIIEAMKVMNEIKAEVAGEVVDILVENGEAVEFGQPLFLIKKSG